jgi:glycosyltransferase involved in cell wall biosynthesis
MRVLFLISDLGFHGAQNQVVELSREMARSGHDVAIYTLNDDAPRAKELEGTGVRVIVDQKRVKLDPAVLWRLNRFIRQWKADVVHGFLYDGDIYARIAAIGTGAAVLNSERSDNYSISRTQHLAHRLTKFLVDGVVANSRSGSAFAQKLYGYAPDRMHVVWNGMRVEDFERRAESVTDYKREFFGPGEHKVATLVGAIKPAKDYHLAVDTAQKLVTRAPGWRVLFLGDSLAPPVAGYKAGVHSDTSDYKAEVMAHFERLQLGDRVKFAGARKDLPAIVKQSDVLFVTSAWEGFPNSVLEAMVLGVPVVSTEYSDIRHILPRPEQVVATRAPEILAEAVVHADLDRDAIAAEQKRWVRTHASIEKATENLERVYDQYIRPRAVAKPA